MPRTGENIYKRKDGRWEARYILFYDENGKAKYRYLYAKTYTEVKNKLFNERAQTINFISAKSNATYAKWLNDWLISKKIIVKESTYIRYKNTIENHIKPELGKYPINKISTELVESFIANKMQNGKKSGGGLSSKSISDIMVIIKETFKFAQSHGETVNCNFSRFPIRKATNEMRVLSVAEEQKLVTVISNSTDRYKLGVLICLYTGIRIGELCALKCKNISMYNILPSVECCLFVRITLKFSVKSFHRSAEYSLGTSILYFAVIHISALYILSRSLVVECYSFSVPIPIGFVLLILL